MTKTEPNLKDLDSNVVSLGFNIIAANMLYLLRTKGLVEMVDESTRNQYRDVWDRVDIKREHLMPWKHNIFFDVMSVEIITTFSKDAEVHYHKDAYAVVAILGEREGVQNPDNCSFYYGAVSPHLKAVPGIILDIAPGVIHGFRSNNGTGKITILSVQSKRITEDFHPVG